MGSNLFVEGRPAPVLIHVILPRSVNSFAELNAIALGLKDVDRTLRQDWIKLWPSFGPRQRREVRLVNFQLRSPPDFLVFSDPAWLAVFLLVVTGYDKLKSNIPLIAEDVGRLLGYVRGLTQRQLQLLEIGVKLSADKVLRATEEGSSELSKRIGRMRRRLIGDSEEPPQIEVVDLVNEERIW